MPALPTLFVSYRRTQLDVVRPVVTALERAGIGCFFDFDDIDPLADFPERVREGIDASHALLAWWSADYGESDHCLAEFRRAWQHARRNSSDVGRRVWVLNPEPNGHHVFAGELNSKNFLKPPTPATTPAWAKELKAGLKALLPEGPLADERNAFPAPTLRNVPIPSQQFTGRGATLMRVHSELFPAQIGSAAVAPGVRLHGMGGLGKTEVAAKYAIDFAHAYPRGVFWLNFAGFNPNDPVDETEAKLAWLRAVEAVFAREPQLQGKLLRDAEGKPLDPDFARERIANWLVDTAPSADAEGQRYLWVVDNVPLMSPLDARDRVLAFWRAPAGAGRTLLTTPDARPAAGFADEPLEALDEADALRLLARRRAIGIDEHGAAESLVREVARHTLAVTLLGEQLHRGDGYATTLASVRRTGRLARLEQLADRFGKDLGAAARSVVATFDLSIAPLSDASKRLLALASFCAPNEPILRALLSAAFGGDDQADEFADALHALQRASLLGRRRDVDTVDIHPLAADVAAHLLDVRPEHEGELLGQVLLARLADASDIRRHPELANDIVHARHLAERLETSTGVVLGLDVGRYEAARGMFAAARVVEARGLDVARKVLGEEHPGTLTSMGNLANTLWAQGNLPGARALQERVLEVSRRVLGEEHPDTLRSMGNLAQTLSDQGDLPGARALQKRVLEVSSCVLGEAHPATLTSMNNLALTLQAQGDLPGARALQERVLDISRRVLGEEHPDTLRSMSNLASTLADQGDLAGTLELEERVVEVSCRVLGEEHPDTLKSENNLADNRQAQGDLAGARELHERVLETRRRVLGEEHPDTLQSKHNLASTLRAQGDLPGARALLELALEVSRRALGEEHPGTARAAFGVLAIARTQGDIDRVGELIASSPPALAAQLSAELEERKRD